MTIGPAPMIRTVLMSVRFGMSARLYAVVIHGCHESIEQIAHIVRPGTGLGMPLERKRRRIGERETLVAAVKQRSVGDAHVRRQGALVDRESMVLAGDQHATTVQVDDRMVGAVVAEFHLQR